MFHDPTSSDDQDLLPKPPKSPFTIEKFRNKFPKYFVEVGVRESTITRLIRT
jgi:hypothetical protein